MLLLILNLKFLFVLVLSLIFTGAVAFERHMRFPDQPMWTDVFVGLSATAFAYLSQHIDGSGWPIAAHFVTAVALVMAVVVYRSHKLAIGLGKAAFMFVMMGVGLLVGSGLLVPAATLAIICLIYFLVSDKLVGSKVVSEYSLTIEVEKMAALSKVEDMLKKFQVYIHQKMIVKHDAIHIQLTYSTTQPTHSLFLKKLFTMDGLGEVSCL